MLIGAHESRFWRATSKPMPKQTPASFPKQRRLTSPECDSYAAHLSRLAVEFEDHCTRLRTSSDQVVPIAAMRAAMSRVGDLLVALLSYGAIEAPRDLPPWLRWRAEPDAMLEFRGWEGSPTHSRWTPTPDVDYVLRSLSAIMHVSQRGCVGHSYGSDTTPILDRLIFVEAVAGWLGMRCTPPPKLALPTAVVIVGPKVAEPRGDDIRVEVAVDWDGRETPQVALLFMELGPACAMACRHLADALRAAINQPTAAPSTGPDGAIITAYEQAKATWLRRVRFTPKVGDEPARVMVSLGKCTSNDVPVPLEAESYPRMDGASIVLLLTHPAADELERESIALADACHDLSDLFKRRLVDGSDARQLAAELRDLPRRPVPNHLDLLMTIDETVLSMPEPDPEVPAAPNDFHHVAIEALDLATRIVKLRTDRLPEWHAHLTRHTPERFAACRRQVRSAESALSYLRHDLAGIEHGPMSTRTFMRLHAARQESKDVGAQVEAEVRTELESQIVTVTGILRLAEAQVETTHLEQIQWARQEKQGWIADDMRKLRKAVPRYRRLLEKHRLRIAAVADPKDIKLGELSADYGSGCEALEIFAREVLKDRRTADFNGVDPDQIRIAVEREIGHACSESNAAFQASTPTPAEPPNAGPESAPPIAVATDLRRDTSELSDLDVNKFCRKDDYWEVTFGRQQAIFRATVGMACIARLIAKPNTPIDAWMLRYSVPAPSLVQDKIIDDVALANVRQSTGALEQLLVETVDLDVREAAETELRIQRSYLAASTEQRGRHRRARTVRNDRDRNRESVGKAIADSIRKIGEKLPSLGEHLTASIDSPSGFAPCYKTAGEMAPWVISQ